MQHLVCLVASVLVIGIARPALRGVDQNDRADHGRHISQFSSCVDPVGRDACGRVAGSIARVCPFQKLRFVGKTVAVGILAGERPHRVDAASGCEVIRAVSVQRFFYVTLFIHVHHMAVVAVILPAGCSRFGGIRHFAAAVARSTGVHGGSFELRVCGEQRVDVAVVSVPLVS